MTVALPGALTHPGAFVSVTESVSGAPETPAVKVIWFVPWPAVIVPFPIVHVNVLPARGGTLAVRFGEPAPTDDGAVMTSGTAGGQRM